MEHYLENAGLLALSAPAAYFYCYVWLRAFGKLRVTAGGFHAAGIGVGRRVALSALAAFRLFQPAMRAESAARRRLARRKKAAAEPAVKDVAVELVPIA